MARKPLSEKTVAENVLKWGTGGINIDECRIETIDNLNGGAVIADREAVAIGKKIVDSKNAIILLVNINNQQDVSTNFILDESAGELLNAQSGI